MAGKRGENGPKWLTGNNEANIKRKRERLGHRQRPPLSTLNKYVYRFGDSVHRLSGSSDVTGAPLTSCHDKTKRKTLPQNRGKGIDQRLR